MAVSDEWALSPTLTSENADSFLRRLKKAKPKLFRPGCTNVRLETILPVNRNDRRTRLSDVADDEQLENILQVHLGLRGETFIYLFQDHSWAPFNLSEDALRQIVTAIQPSPEFLRLFNGFGPPDEGYEADFSGGYVCHVGEGISRSSEHDDKKAPEHNAQFAYTLRYAAMTGRSESPWSERKMGVYHKFDAATSVWVILQPTSAALGLPKAAPALRWRKIGPPLPHILLFQSSLPAWMAYLKCLEAHVRKSSRDGRLAGKEVDLDLAFSSVQELQYHSELLHNIVAALRSDREILLGLQSLGMASGSPGDAMLHHELSTCMSQFRMDQEWAEDMLDRAKQVSNLMTVLFYAKHSQTLTANTTAMSQLTQDSQKDQELMLRIAKAAKKDSEVMKVIAAVTLCYLPATLVTSLFSTGFVTSSLADQGPGTHDRTTTQAIIYACVTALLTLVTCFASYFWYSRSQKGQEQANAINLVA